MSRPPSQPDLPDRLRHGGHCTNPVYEPIPRDATVKFRRILARKWGHYYTFRYLGGIGSGARFTVESYSPSTASPSTAASRA